MDNNQFRLSNTYIVLDIETTGFQPTTSAILQIGYLLCVEGEIKTRGAIFVAQDDAVLTAYENAEYVQSRIAQGRSDYVKAADVRSFGVPAKDVFGVIMRVHDYTMDTFPDAKLVGHNIGSFDLPFLEYHFARVGLRPQFDLDRVVDTGMLFKASMLNEAPRVGETPWMFQRRISERRSTVKWNLAHTVQTFGLDTKYGLNVAAAHDAGVDCLFTHYLYQSLREQQLLGSAA